MKKTLLAAAVLVGFAGAAQAETSVTLYGIVDMGVGYQKIKGQGLDASRTGLIDGAQSGSRWGLRGSEDLGGGLRATFVLESGFNPRTGRSAQGGRLFGRQATIGLASDAWGEITAGRRVNVSSQFFSSIDPFAAGFGQSNMGSAFSVVNTIRYDNLIQYTTPSIGGFQVAGGYSFDIGEDAAVGELGGANTFATNRKDRAITGGLRYANGPLNVAATYDQVNAAAGTVGGTKIKSWTVGGSFDFEVAKLALAYGQTKNGWFGSPGLQSNQTFSGGVDSYTGLSFADGSKVTSYLVGLTAPMGPGSLFGTWQRADADNDRLTGDDATQNTYSLGYTYDLSKRTNVYAYGSYAKNYAFINDVKSQLVGVGVRHRF